MAATACRRGRKRKPPPPANPLICISNEAITLRSRCPRHNPEKEGWFRTIFLSWGTHECRIGHLLSETPARGRAGRRDRVVVLRAWPVHPRRAARAALRRAGTGLLRNDARGVCASRAKPVGVAGISWRRRFPACDRRRRPRWPLRPAARGAAAAAKATAQDRRVGPFHFPGAASRDHRV